MISILESTCEQKKKGLVHATHRDGPHQQVYLTKDLLISITLKCTAFFYLRFFVP